MSGYYGFSMSNNAVEAYKNGEMPLSKWTKKAILEEAEKYTLQCSLEKLKQLPLALLRDKLLYESSWHHTSKFYNETNFYSFNEDEISEITDDQLDQWMEMLSSEKKAVKAAATEERWKCSFLEWSGTRNHPRAERVVDTGVIRGNWFYRDHGGKKSVNANGFEKVERLYENEKGYNTMHFSCTATAHECVLHDHEKDISFPLGDPASAIFDRENLSGKEIADNISVFAESTIDMLYEESKLGIQDENIDLSGYSLIERTEMKTAIREALQEEYFAENKKTLSDVKRLVSEKKPRTTENKQKTKNNGR